MKRKIIAAVIVVALVIALSATLIACSGNNDKGKTEGEAVTYVALDINPSVELMLDENNVVLSARGLNEDAKVLLYNEEGIVGSKIDVAVNKITALAMEMKYLREDNNTINVNVTSKLGETVTNNIIGQIKSEITDGKWNFNLHISMDGSFSLQRELEALKAKYPDNEAIQSIDINKYRLIVEAMEINPKLDIEVAASMDISRLIDIIDDARDDILDALPEIYEDQIEMSERIYERVVERLESGIYLKVIDIDNPLEHKDIAKELVLYPILRNAAISLDEIEEGLEYAEDAINKELAKADIEKIAALLGEENVDAFMENADINKDGILTIDELEDYIDIRIKNMAAAEKERLEDELDDMLDELEDKYEDLMNSIPEDIKVSIKVIIDVPELEALFEELGKIDWDDFDFETLEDIEEMIDEKADEYEEIIIRHLSEEEREEVANLLKDIQGDSAVLEAKKRYQENVKKIIDEATKWLESMKEDRANL